jgi:hypothetical protein
MSTSAISAEPRAQTVQLVPDGLTVHLKDGRTLTVPLEWFPWLRDASEADRQNFELYADGYAIHWPALDGDISIPGLLGLRTSAGRRLCNVKEHVMLHSGAA